MQIETMDMGLPLNQAKQQYNSMDLVMKKELFSMVERTANKFDLSGIIFGSFTLQYGYKNQFSASDYVYSMMSLMEQIEHDKTAESCFLQALEGLSRNRKEILEIGIEKAKILLDTIFKQVKTSLESKLVNSTGSFLYIVLQEENILFAAPYGLTMLAKFIQQAFLSNYKNRKMKDMPLIVSIPVDHSRGINMLTGIPPLTDDTKNLFGKVFEAAATKSHAAVSQDFVDTNIIQIKQSDLMKFFDALTVLLSS
jgi:cell division control protein 45